MSYSPEAHRRTAFDGVEGSVPHAETHDERWLRLRGRPRPAEELTADEKTWLHVLENLGLTEQTLAEFQKKWWITLTCRKGKYSGATWNLGKWETITGRVTGFSRLEIQIKTSANETVRVSHESIKRRKDGTFVLSKFATISARERRHAARVRARVDKRIRKEEQKKRKRTQRIERKNAKK
ncbi:MAG: hypothetical protein KGI73_02940 [Patescibacteria group bacterium]|nr:hypothetical protein [Patescibacteria group bacterium]